MGPAFVFAACISVLGLLYWLEGDPLSVVSAVRYISRTRHRGLNPSFDEAQDLVEAVKNGDPAATQRAADLLAPHLQGFPGLVVPVPRSDETRPSLLGLAQALVDRGVGAQAERLLVRRHSVPSSRHLRRAGQMGVPPDDHAQSMEVVTLFDTNAPILLVDDMLTRGNTLRGAREALRRSGHQGPVLGATVGGYVRAEEASGDAFEALFTTI